MDSLDLWLVLILGGLGTYLIRLSFILIFQHIQIPAYMERILRLVPPAVFSAIVLPELLVRDGSVQFHFHKPASDSRIAGCPGCIKNPQCTDYYSLRYGYPVGFAILSSSLSLINPILPLWTTVWAGLDLPVQTFPVNFLTRYGWGPLRYLRQPGLLQPVLHRPCHRKTPPAIRTH